MAGSRRVSTPGGFTADLVPPKSRYELDDGHPAWCALDEAARARIAADAAILASLIPRAGCASKLAAVFSD